jgi:hypothetical protein
MHAEADQPFILRPMEDGAGQGEAKKSGNRVKKSMRMLAAEVLLDVVEFI